MLLAKLKFFCFVFKVCLDSMGIFFTGHIISLLYTAVLMNITLVF